MAIPPSRHRDIERWLDSIRASLRRGERPELDPDVVLEHVQFLLNENGNIRYRLQDLTGGGRTAT